MRLFETKEVTPAKEAIASTNLKEKKSIGVPQSTVETQKVVKSITNSLAKQGPLKSEQFRLL